MISKFHSVVSNASFAQRVVDGNVRGESFPDTPSSAYVLQQSVLNYASKKKSILKCFNISFVRFFIKLCPVLQITKLSGETFLH